MLSEPLQNWLHGKYPPWKVKAILGYAEVHGLGDEEFREHLDPEVLPDNMNQEPVGMREFLLSPYYMNAKGFLYPEVVKYLCEINGERPFVEVVLTGGIGSAKTTIALYSQAYQLYKLSCYVDPHAEFELDPSSEIMVIFQSLNEKLAKAVDYERFKSMILRSHYFRQYFMFDTKIESEMRFPNRIIVKPVTGEETGAIGQNVIGGVIDEMNFMAVTKNSAKAVDTGEYDQAWTLYRSITRRRQSRFMSQREFPGLLCLVSSKRYPGQFTDVKTKEAKTNPLIYVYDKRVWDIKPAKTFSQEFFHLFVGDTTRKPYVMGAGDKVRPEDRALVMKVPEEYRHDFENDMMASLRDIAGVSTLALHPFMMNTERVTEAFGKVQSVLSRPDCDFVNTTVKVMKSRFLRPTEPRFVHIDLALSGDSAGVAMGFVPGFTKVDRGEDIYEVYPNIVFDFVLEVVPPKNGEINFAKIRKLLIVIRDQFKIPVTWVTLDSFQSTDTKQILENVGFRAGIQSMDISTTPYDVSKTAIMDGRVVAPEHPRAQREWVTLERDVTTNKIDHPPHSSKDCSDAMAGVIYGITRRKVIWVKHGIPLDRVPTDLKNVSMGGKRSLDALDGEDGLG